MKVSEVADIINEFAPFALKESYDNVGLQIGNPESIVTGAILTIDITEAVIDEAIARQCNLIVAHHPLIFKGVKQIVGKNLVERSILKAIKNDIAIIIAHTNIDSVNNGVSRMMSDKLGLKNCKVLAPRESALLKLVTFIPSSSFDVVREAIFEAGAGHIGDYSKCGYSANGEGSFMAAESANPFVGEKMKFHVEPELKFETILPFYKKSEVISALKRSHPYEEVAYDIYQLQNVWDNVGYGLVGELADEMELDAFLEKVKSAFELKSLRYTELKDRMVKRIAVSGGSGSDLLVNAKSVKADVLISADFKYHQFFDAENQIAIVDIGHYESEQYTKELFFDILTKKISTFALHKSSVNTNPIKYL